MSHEALDPLDGLVRELARLSPADQTAIAQALPTAQLESLIQRFNAPPVAMSFVEVSAAVQASAQATEMAELDLTALPPAVVATAMVGLSEADCEALLKPLSAEHRGRVAALRLALPAGALTKAGPCLRGMLMHANLPRRRPDAAGASEYDTLRAFERAAPVPWLKRAQSWLSAS